MRHQPHQEGLVHEDLLDEAVLYERHWRDVMRWVTRLGGPFVDVEDLVHEVFLQAFAALPSFRHEAKVTTWLFCITTRTVALHRRRARWRRWLSGLAGDYLDRCASQEPLPGEALERRDESKKLYESLNKLPEDMRTTFILFELEEMTAQEISELQKVTVSTVWVRLHRARKRLAALMPKRPTLAGEKAVKA